MGYNEQKVDKLLIKAGILQNNKINTKFYEDLHNLFWKRIWIKWKLEKTFSSFIEDMYCLAKSTEPLITKEDVKRDTLEALKARIFFEIIENKDYGKSDLSYIG